MLSFIAFFWCSKYEVVFVVMQDYVARLFCRIKVSDSAFAHRLLIKSLFRWVVGNLLVVRGMSEESDAEVFLSQAKELGIKGWLKGER